MQAFYKILPPESYLKDFPCACVQLYFPAVFGADFQHALFGSDIKSIDVIPGQNFCLRN